MKQAVVSALEAGPRHGASGAFMCCALAWSVRKRQVAKNNKRRCATGCDCIHLMVREAVHVAPSGGQMATPGGGLDRSQDGVLSSALTEHSTVPYSTAHDAPQVEPESGSKPAAKPEPTPAPSCIAIDIAKEWAETYGLRNGDPADFDRLLRSQGATDTPADQPPSDKDAKLWDEILGVITWMKGINKDRYWLKRISGSADFVRCYKKMHEQFLKCGGSEATIKAASSFPEKFFAPKRPKKQELPLSEKEIARLVGAEAGTVAVAEEEEGDTFAVEDVKDTDGLEPSAEAAPLCAVCGLNETTFCERDQEYYAACEECRKQVVIRLPEIAGRRSV